MKKTSYTEEQIALHCILARVKTLEISKSAWN